jgi:hypothetical protein
MITILSVFGITIIAVLVYFAGYADGVLSERKR